MTEEELTQDAIDEKVKSDVSSRRSSASSSEVGPDSATGQNSARRPAKAKVVSASTSGGSETAFPNTGRGEDAGDDGPAEEQQAAEKEATPSERKRASDSQRRTVLGSKAQDAEPEKKVYDRKTADRVIGDMEAEAGCLEIAYRQLPFVDSMGKSECPDDLLEELYDRAADCADSAEAFIEDKARPFVPLLREELGKQRRVCSTLAHGASRLELDETRTEYQDARSANQSTLQELQRELKRLQESMAKAQRLIPIVRTKVNAVMSRRKKHGKGETQGQAVDTGALKQDRGYRRELKKTKEAAAIIGKILAGDHVRSDQPVAGRRLPAPLTMTPLPGQNPALAPPAAPGAVIPPPPQHPPVIQSVLGPSMGGGSGQ